MKHQRFNFSNRVLFFSLLLLVLGLAYFLINTPPKEAASSGEKKGKSVAVWVTTAKAQRANIPIEVTAIGNVEAFESVAVQPQITGQLKKTYFNQGQHVHRGQLLFEIDARLQQATVTQMTAVLARTQASIRQARANLAKSFTQLTVATANLKRDKAQQHFAQLQVNRYHKLLGEKYVAQVEYEQAQNLLNAADATLVADQAALNNAQAQVQADRAALQTAQSSANADKAALEMAKIQLQFTKIHAPIAGKTGPLLVNVGNNVQANATVLVNIKKISPIYVVFSIPEKQLPAFQRAMKQASTQVVVTIQGEPLHGDLVFIDNTINKNNGTVALKAEFMNAEGKLWPGQFVQATTQLGIQQQVLTIPAKAIQKGPNGDFVYLIKNKVAHPQVVLVDRIANGQAVIVKGLNPNQEVITEGLQSVAPNMEVQVSGKKP